MFFYLQEDLTKETLHKQYHLVKSHTNTSHVMQYGNKVSRALLANFLVLEPQACSFRTLSLDKEKWIQVWNGLRMALPHRATLSPGARAQEPDLLGSYLQTRALG